MAVFEGFQLTLNCDFVAVADRKRCQVFYGQERLLGEEVAAYSFFDDASFDKALETATVLSGKLSFEKLWSAKRFDDRPGGYVCLKRFSGDSLLLTLKKVSRRKQYKLCLQLIEAVGHAHKLGFAHGALDEDNVLYNKKADRAYILEVLSGFDADQLEPHLHAPEQAMGKPASYATDIYWIANLYLKAIKRPSPGLKRLIKKCLRKDLAKRPTLEEVAVTLQELYRSDWQLAIKRMFQPKAFVRFAGVALTLAAGTILAFDAGWIKLPTNQQTLQQTMEAKLKASTDDPLSMNVFKQELEAAEDIYTHSGVLHEMLAYTQKHPEASNNAKKILRKRYENDTRSRIRESLVTTMSEVSLIRQNNDLQTSFFSNNFSSDVEGVFLFDWPVIVVKKDVWQLGDWVNVEGVDGYIAQISLTEIAIKNGSGTRNVKLEIPPMLSNLDWKDRNIFLKGGHSNLALVLKAMSVYGFDVISSQPPTGIISGFFSFESPNEFIDTSQNFLKLARKGTTIWVEDSPGLRTFIPVENKVFEEKKCIEIFDSLLGLAGFQYELDHTCDHKESIYIINAELRDVFSSLGYSLDSTSDLSHFSLSRKE